MNGRSYHSNIFKTVFFIFLYLILLPCSCQKSDESIVTSIQPKISEILGRPEKTSITINILSNSDTEVFWEYGTLPGSYTLKSETYYIEQEKPQEAVFRSLTEGTKYYYRTCYRIKGSSGTFFTSEEHTFQTWQSTGNTFKFAIEADPHLDYNSDTAAYALTLRNMAAENPDFLLDLGDTFMAEKLTPPLYQADITDRYLLLRSFFDRICNSIPLYLVLGNHEGELGWRNDGTEASMPVMVSNTRKLYYPNPAPDQFYSGNTKSDPFVGQRQNYFSWEWGDVLFVVLDPFWYSLSKPGWGYTLGKDQYDWFKGVLANSTAKFKFVFCHNLVGGNGNDARGGTEFVDLFEMGGKNLDGTYGFDTYRSGWGKPLHQLMVENNVTVFFHGHDHFYGKQEKDGIIYQEVPQPSNRNITNISASEYGYSEGVLLPGRGYLLVTVSSQSVKVEYIATLLPGEETSAKKNRAVLSTYTLY